jgi:hypothetical protein
VRAGYLAAAERLDDVVVVACDARAPDEIAAELAAAVRARRVPGDRPARLGDARPSP